jgi:hypothetical protein
LISFIASNIDDIPLSDDEIELSSSLPLGKEEKAEREEAHR